MIKAKAESGNVFLGLSHENIQRLKAGQDLATDLFVVGVDCRLMITVVASNCPPELWYGPTSDQRPGMSLGVPAAILDTLVEAGVALFNTRMAGAPFDVHVVIRPTEQAILEMMNATDSVVSEIPASARVH